MELFRFGAIISFVISITILSFKVAKIPVGRSKSSRWSCANFFSITKTDKVGWK